jgi:hypothetical protein
MIYATEGSAMNIVYVMNVARGHGRERSEDFRAFSGLDFPESAV